MMRAATFEVSVEISGKPEIEGIYPDEKIARDRALDLLKLAKYTAVRVYKIGINDSHRLIFEKIHTGAIGNNASIIAAIDHAYVCTTVHDVYLFESRSTLLHLLRGYFDQQLILPLELLHDPMALRYLERDALLFNQALHRLAALQGQQLRIKPTERYDRLSRLFRDILDLSKTSDRLTSYAEDLIPQGLTALVDRVAMDWPEDEQARVITFALARHLREARDWALKLNAAHDLFDENQSAPAAAWIDELLAEIIDGNAAVKAIVGYAPDLATALSALVAALDGTWDDRLPGTPSLRKLNEVMARQSAPRVRTALLNRISTALGGQTPLTKGDRVSNGEALKRLLPKLKQFGGFMGGPAMAAALTRRVKVDLSTRPEDLSFEETINTLCTFLPNPAGKIGYLLDLLSSDMGRRRTAHITRMVADLFSQLRSIRDFAPHADSTWSHDMVREEFRCRLYQAGIPHALADGLIQKLEILQNNASMSASSSKIENTHSVNIGKLVLIYRGLRYVIVAEETPFTIGRSPESKLTIDWNTASRTHAVIHVEGSDFILVDQSKNGTYVRIENRKTIALAKNSTILYGQGTITIGITGDCLDAAESAIIGFERVGVP